MSLRKTEKRGKKKRRKRITIMTEKQEKPLYAVIKRLLPPLFKTRPYYLSNQRSKAAFTTGIVSPFLKKREGESIYSLLCFTT